MTVTTRSSRFAMSSTALASRDQIARASFDQQKLNGLGLVAIRIALRGRRRLYSEAGLRSSLLAHSDCHVYEDRVSPQGLVPSSERSGRHSLVHAMIAPRCPCRECKMQGNRWNKCDRWQDPDSAPFPTIPTVDADGRFTSRLTRSRPRVLKGNSGDSKVETTFRVFRTFVGHCSMKLDATLFCDGQTNLCSQSGAPGRSKRSSSIEAQGCYLQE